MEKSLEELVKEYKEKEKKVQNIEIQIQNLREKFEKTLEPLKEELETAKKEMFERNEVVSVRLGDLIEELSNLTGISVENMDYDVNISNICKTEKSSCSEKSREELWTEEPVHLFLTIQSQKTENFASYDEQTSMEFYYNHSFYSYLFTLQADGKTLFGHTHTIAYYIGEYPNKKITTQLLIKKEDMDNIICKFNLYSLAASKELNSFHPRELLLKAILNILNKQKECEIGMQKTLKRSGKSEKRK